MPKLLYVICLIGIWIEILFSKFRFYLTNDRKKSIYDIRLLNNYKKVPI